MGARGILSVWATLLVAVLAGCGEEPPSAASARDATVPTAFACDGDAGWTCPPGWIASPYGGCGPAVLLCAPGGGVSGEPCAARELREATPVDAADRDAGWRFNVQPDGAIGGGWSAQPTACPSGWEATGEGDCVPASGACAHGGGALPDGRCVRTSLDACPDATFPPRGAEMLGGSVVYVLAGATAVGADGTEERPLPSLSEGLARAGRDGWVLLGGGAYREALRIEEPRRLVGVCAARVEIGRRGDAAVVAHAAVTLRGVTVAGGVLVEGRGALAAREIVVNPGDSYGLLVTGEDAAADLRDAVFGPLGAMGGSAVSIDARARLSLDGFVIADGRGNGVTATGGATVTLSNGVIRGMRLYPGAFRSGRAIVAIGAAAVTGARLALDDNQAEAIEVSAAGSRLALVDAVIRGTRPADRTGGGKAIEVNEGAVATLERTRIEASSNTAASAFTGATLTLRDCHVLDTRERGVGNAGRGIDAHHGGTLVAERVVVEGSHEVAVFSFDGSRVTLRDVLIRRTRAPTVGFYGAGLAAIEGTVDARRVVVEDSTEVGVALVGPRVDATLEDVIVRGVRPSSRGFAMGVVTAWGARARLERIAVTDTRGVAVGEQAQGLGGLATDGTSVDVTDLYVRGVERAFVQYDDARVDQPAEYVAAYGVSVGARCAMTLRRFVIDEAATGVSSFGALDASFGALGRVGEVGVRGRAVGVAEPWRLRGLACRSVLRPSIRSDEGGGSSLLPVSPPGN